MERYLKKKIEVNVIECAICNSRDVVGVPFTKVKEKTEMIMLLCKQCTNTEIIPMQEYQNEMQKVE